MAKGGSLEQLVHEAANDVRIECAPLAMLVHVLFEILLTVLKDEDELCLCMDDIVQSDDIDMLELLHERYLSDGSRRSALLWVEMDFLESDDFICCARPALSQGSMAVKGRPTEWLTL